nr:hypothetical protein [uncultured bacterium]
MVSTALRLTILLLLLLISLGAKASDDLRVGVGLGMEEIIGTSSGNLSGVLAPIYHCVFETAGIEPRYVSVPVKRGLQYLRSNKISALLPLAQNADRDGKGVFAGTLFEAEYAFVSLKPLPQLHEAEGLRYAIPRSFIGRQFIPEESARIQEVTEWEQIAALLKYDRVDVAIIPEPMIERLFGEFADQVHRRIAGRLPVSMYLSGAIEENGTAERIKRSVTLCRMEDPETELPEDE